MVIIRLYDLIMIIFFFLMSVSFSMGTIGNEIHSSFIIFVCVLFIVSIFVTIFLSEFINFSGRIVLKMLSRPGPRKSAIGLKAEFYLERFKGQTEFFVCNWQVLLSSFNKLFYLANDLCDVLFCHEVHGYKIIFYGEYSGILCCCGNKFSSDKRSGKFRHS